MKNPKKWDYINDFKMTADGKYTYMGDWYSLEDINAYKKVYLIFFLIAFVNAALVIGAGLINAAGMNNTFYVILPYVAQVCSAFALVWKSIRVVSAGEKIKGYVFETAIQRIPAALMSLFVFSIITLLSSIVFIILNGTENKLMLCILFIVIQVLTAISAFVCRLYHKRQKWIKQ